MRNAFSTLAAIVGVIAGALGALYGALYLLFDGLSAARIAGIVTAAIVAAAVAALAVLWVVNRVMGRARMSAAIHDDAIAGEYRELTTYKPLQPALPAPRIITIPRMTASGAPMPYGMPAQPVPILRTTTDAGELQIPLDKLMRFMALPGPRRAEWVGKPDTYGAALAFAETHGLLERTANGGARWLPQYPLEARRAWLAQFEAAARPGDER